MIGRIRSLIVKEFLAVWRDKKSRVILIVPPLVQMLIFTFAEDKIARVDVIGEAARLRDMEIVPLESGSG